MELVENTLESKETSNSDWKFKQLENYIDLLTGFPFESTGYSTNGIKLLRGSNIKRGNTDWNPEITKYWDKMDSFLKPYLLKDGDIVIAMDGSLVGRSFAQLSNKDIPSLLLQRVARLRAKGIDQSYLKELVCCELFTKHCDAVKTSSAIPHISPSDIKSYVIPIPPTILEQQAIAQVLSDTDKLIQSLEKKIAKKKLIKQGVMQALLTPKEGWEVKKLGDYVKIKSGESPSKFDFVDSGVPYYKVEQLNSANKYLSESSFYVGTGCHSVKDSIVFPKRGASILLNKVRILTKDSYIDTNLMTLTVQEGLSNEFLYYFLLHFGLWRVADTTSIPQINNKHINPLEIKLPDFEEQKSIAAVLKDIEEEIELHEFQLSKYRNLKQALMQQLLTGKIRLV